MKNQSIINQTNCVTWLSQMIVLLGLLSLNVANAQYQFNKNDFYQPDFLPDVPSGKWPQLKEERSRPVKLAAGTRHSCALLKNGEVRCWGANSAGQLGNSTNTSSTTPVIVKGISNAVDITAGGRHTCVKLVDETIKCWGANDHGQLGTGTNISSNIPVRVVGSSFLSITAGEAHTCATKRAYSHGSAEKMQCWGNNDAGQLGNLSAISYDFPVDVWSAETPLFITAGGTHTCFSTAGDSEMKCWGYNRYGQVGDGTRINRLFPTAVRGSGLFQQIAAGSAHSCATYDSGDGENRTKIRCWGSNDYGQLGFGRTGGFRSTSKKVELETPPYSIVYSLVAGGRHSCIAYSKRGPYRYSSPGGMVSCWGQHWPSIDGLYGVSTAVPIKIPSLSDIVGLAAGRYHTCGLGKTGAIRCWGYNGNGQLGNGMRSPLSVLDSVPLADAIRPVEVIGYSTMSLPFDD